MAKEVECKSADEANAAILAGDVPVLCGDFELSVSANVRIVCRGPRTLECFEVDINGKRIDPPPAAEAAE